MSQRLPSFDVYCYGTTSINALKFYLGEGLIVWFSYRTPVAFWSPTHSFMRSEGDQNFRSLKPLVRENDWGPTTGRHLNAIDERDYMMRVSGAIFEQKLLAALEGRTVHEGT